MSGYTFDRVLSTEEYFHIGIYEEGGIVDAEYFFDIAYHVIVDFLETLA